MSKIPDIEWPQIDLSGWSDNAMAALRKRYFMKGPNGEILEDLDSWLKRVAWSIASAEVEYIDFMDAKLSRQAYVEQWAKVFYEMMANREFFPNSPTLANAGKPNGQLSACFALPLNDSMEEIYSTLKDTALILRSGGGVGFSFSHIRREGGFVKSTGGKAGGPVAFMEVFNTSGGIVKQGGMRKGAHMALLSCLAGDTIIKTIYGPALIKDLVGKRPYLYCTDGDHVFVRQADAVFCNGKKSLVRVTLDDNTYVDCTSDHRFLLRSGKYKEAGDLVRGDSLLRMSRSIMRYAQTEFYPFLSLCGKRSGYKPEHRCIMEAVLSRNLSIDEDVHHANGDKCDNNIDNLRVLSKSDHARITALETPEFIEAGKRFIREKRYDLPEYKQKLLDANNKRHGRLDPITWEMVVEASHDCNSMRSLARKLNCDRNVFRRLGYERIRQLVGATTGRRDDITWELIKQVAPSCTSIMQLSDKLGCDRSIFKRFDYDRIKEIVNTSANHKVVGVEYLDREEEVFDITMPEFHNFAIDGDIFVHNCNHPDIMKFITCKADTTKLTNFNISVAITDAFMKAVVENKTWWLIDPATGERINNLPATEIFEAIAHQAHATGEPGMVFIDRINQYNPVPSMGDIEATNPCAELPLLPYGSCNLGSINLDAMLITDGENWQIDLPKLENTVRNAVRFLDDVITVNSFPMQEIKDIALGLRNIGLGIMGFADALIRMKISYGSEACLGVVKNVMSFISNIAMDESMELAKARGPFLEWENSIYKDKFPIRNATRTCIAPTGTISMFAGCSGGIEPIYATAFERRILDTTLTEEHPYFRHDMEKTGIYTPEIMREIAKPERAGSLKGLGLPKAIADVYKTAHDVSIEEHIMVQSIFQRYVDNSISKTINLHEDATVEDIMYAYKLAFESGCKGITVYRNNSRSFQPMSVGSVAVVPKQEITKPRPKRLNGTTEVFNVGGCGALYVTVNKDDDGNVLEIGAMTGRASGCSALINSLNRNISTSLRHGVPIDAIIEQLVGIRCLVCVADPQTQVLSCADAIGRAIQHTTDKQERFSLNVFSSPKMEICELCGNMMRYSEGCSKCLVCENTKCE